jgi:hypothetical protein
MRIEHTQLRHLALDQHIESWEQRIGFSHRKNPRSIAHRSFTSCRGERFPHFACAEKGRCARRDQSRTILIAPVTTIRPPHVGSITTPAPEVAAVREPALHGVRGPEARPLSPVVADLVAGRITPHEAVARLTTQALERARCPETLRPVVEARIREALTYDPNLAALVRQMGGEGLGGGSL